MAEPEFSRWDLSNNTDFGHDEFEVLNSIFVNKNNYEKYQNIRKFN